MKVIGCDVAKTFVILHDGQKHFYINDTNIKQVHELVKDNIVVLEQTGSYGVRWAYIFSDLGAKVFVADGKEFKAFRNGRDRRKDDWIDAYYLRLFYKDQTKRKYCKPFNPIMIKLRTLIRQHIRNEKDITRSMNRLMQYTAMIFPYDEYYSLKRSKFIQALDKIEQKLIDSPNALSGVALMELRKLKVSLSQQKILEEEIRSIARNHPDYELLMTFPGFGEILIATLIAYYWNIKNFPDVDAFIGYVLMGSLCEQSGISLNRVKTDKARTEVKGKFFNLFRSAHIKNRRGYTHPYNPLAEVLKVRVFGGWNMKKRYIKFLSRIFELVYYALKYRMTYKEVLKFKIRELEKNINNLRSLPGLTKIQAFELSRAVENLEVYKYMLKLISPECQDISDSPKGEAERPVYFGRENRDEPEQVRPCQGSISQTKEHLSSPEPEDDRRCDTGVPEFLRRKNPLPKPHRPAPPIRNPDQKDQEDTERFPY